MANEEDIFTDEDFEKFFGCAPNLTGGLTAAEYVAEIRGRGKHALTCPTCGEITSDGQVCEQCRTAEAEGREER